ncbi:hypothetical protein [Rhodococcus sp. NBC_00294]|uniref:hypothetical protein n=1 Tax=Rhodococcus sp. NBC_00294 TaxID=2976004 RepID=UPI002E2BD67E|nr:hypothetical protein [Rhodococcus sp. NBC_00294]
MTVDAPSSGGPPPMPPTGTECPRLPAWWRWLTIAVTVLAIAACVVILWAFIPPTVLFPIFALASAVLAVLGLVWLILAIVGWSKFGVWKLSAIAVVVVLSTAVLVVFSVPSRAAFAGSEGVLRAVATECSPSSEYELVGAYLVRAVRPVGGGGCRIDVVGGLFESVGFVYLPNSTPSLEKPRRDGEIWYTELKGDWYTVVQSF